MKELMNELREKLIAFAQDLVKIKSMTYDEEAVVRRIRREMEALDYDRVEIDETGNVVGFIGNGPTQILFDSHVDTVTARPEEWTYGPWDGTIHDGKLYGRGATDMKSSAAASVYGAYAAKRLGFTQGKTLVVSCSVMEEDIDGVALANEFRQLNLAPDYAVICEPTNLRISNGHNGRALFAVRALGDSVHAGRHQLGRNALYAMLPIAARVEALGQKLLETGAGSIAATKISSKSPSINSIPSECTMVIDRRLTLEDTYESVSREMDGLVQGVNAHWEVITVASQSWTGQAVQLNSFIPAWETPEESELVIAARDALQSLAIEPCVYKRPGGTNGRFTAGDSKIPTIIFGAGDECVSHMVDEFCPVEDIVTACAFYARLVSHL